MDLPSNHKDMWDQLKEHYLHAMMDERHTPQYKMFATTVVNKMAELEHQNMEGDS